MADESDIGERECYTLPRLYEGAVVTNVFRDKDDEWWLYDYEPWDVTEVIGVAIGEMVKVDGTLKDVLDLPLGWEAERSFRGGDWERNEAQVPDGYYDK